MSRDWTEDEPLDKAAEMAARTVRAAGQAKQTAEAIQAAHLAAGAAKSGAAVSATAAGTALGGSLGAVIGAVLSRRTFWKAAGAVLAAVSAILLKSMVEENTKDFLGWTQTGTHTEMADGGEEEDEEIEIVDYSIVVKLNSDLTPPDTGYCYSYVTSQTTFNYVLKLFELLKDGPGGILDLLFKATSWKNYVLGAGASEDIYTSEIQAGGDTISYDTVRGCVKEVVYFNQGEEPWASLPYGSSTIKSAGCGPTALAIVISTLTGENVTPQMTAEYAMSHGLYVSGMGTSHSFPAMAAGSWGLAVDRVKKEQMGYVVKQLKEGRLAVVICAENTISGGSGHFIVLTGVTEDGYIAIADPGSRSRTGKLYSPATIQSYARDLSDGGIWIMGGQ